MLLFNEEKKTNFSFIGELKQGLLSRDPNIQVQVIQLIIELITNEKCCRADGLQASDILLDADITEFLCEAMATLHSSVLDTLFVCLGYLARNEKFFRNNHVLFVLECLLRATLLLLKRMQKSQALVRGLELLAVLLQGMSTAEKVKPRSMVNLGQVMAVLDFVLHKWQNIDIDILVPVGLVLHGLLSNQSITQQLDPSLFHQISTIVHDALEKLSAYVSNLKRKHNISIKCREAVSLMCHIIILVIKLCSVLRSIDKEETKSELQIRSKYVNCMLQDAVSCFTNVCSPYVLNSKFESSSIELYQSFLSCLRVFYMDAAQEIDIHLLSNILAENEFLVYLILMSSWLAENCSWLRPVCLMVMVDFLTTLSVNALDVVRLWSNDVADFREHLQTGIQCLPSDHTKWLQLLSCSNTYTSTQNVIVIIVFFCCLSLKRPEVMAECFQPLVLYLTSLPNDIHLPLPIVKALWLSFAVCSLSYSQPLYTEQAMNKMILLLGQQVQLQDVYTHNPALLYWVFSNSIIPSFLQYQVMVLWLEEEKNSNNRILLDLMLTSAEVIFCLLDVLQGAPPEISNTATAVLKYAMSCLSPFQKDAISAILWDTLPHTLVTLSCNFKIENANSVSNLMQITSIAIPPSLSNTTVVRSAFLLTRIMVNLTSLDASTQKEFVNQALLLLLLSMETQDKKVFELYVSETKFLDTIMMNLSSSSNDPELKVLAITLLYHLQNYHNKEKLFKCENTVCIDGKLLLQLLYEKNLKISSAGMQLLHALLLASPKMPLLKIVDGFNEYVTVEFIQRLFLSLQNICAVNLVNISFTGWRCLSAILQFVSVHKMEIPNLKKHLASQPWTYVLIRLTLCSALPFQNDSFLQFINNWVACHQPDPLPSSHIRRIEKGTRMPRPSILSQCLTTLAVALLKEDLSKEDYSKRDLILDTMRKILNAKACLSNETTTALREFIKKSTL